MRILVTGAAGLLGGEVCARLVRAGHSVTALIHRNPEIRANDGSAVAVAATLRGDIARDRLGLDDAGFASASAHDLVIHCAASVRFDLTEEEYAATNVRGTGNVLALAEAGGMSMLHVSTAYVCGTRDGAILESDALPVDGPDAGFANGYEASKAAGEQLVRASGARWAIARPSVVVGAHGDGEIRQFDTIYAAFKLIAEGRISHLPALPDATLDFVPIDHVAGGIVALAKRMEAATGGTFHLVAERPVPVAAFTDAIAGYPQFHRPELVAPDRFDPTALPPLERRLYTRVAALYASYFQRDPRFDDTALRALTGLHCPPTDAAFVGRLVDYAIAQGFLKAAPVLVA